MLDSSLPADYRSKHCALGSPHDASEGADARAAQLAAINSAGVGIAIYSLGLLSNFMTPATASSSCCSGTVIVAISVAGLS